MEIYVHETVSEDVDCRRWL